MAKLSSRQARLNQRPLCSKKFLPVLPIGNADEDEVEDRHGMRTLNLTHPLLRLLDSIGGGLKQFDQTLAHLVLSGLLQHPLAAGCALKCLSRIPLSIDRTVYLFSHLDYPDAFTINIIFRCFLNLKSPYSALHFYHHQVLPKNVQPNHYTFPLLTKICAELQLPYEGEKIHGLSLKFGLDSDLFVQNSLIFMHFSLRNPQAACKLFGQRSAEDVVTWNSMIDGYAKMGMVGVSRVLFDRTPIRDLLSWNAMLAGYAGNGDMDSAEELFVDMPVRDFISWNTMLDGYAKIGMVEVAREVFDRMPDRNLVSWNIILALYTRIKKYNECLLLFDRMVGSGEAKPNELTLVSVLTACAHCGALDRGKLIHYYVRDNNIKSDVLLSTALLTMYAKCGDMDSAAQVFSEMPAKTVVSWNAMIMGHAFQGKGQKSLELFSEMLKNGPVPNDITFLCVLSACAHCGLVLEGWWSFDLMCQFFKIEPRTEHYGCMVDLFGRAGLLKDSSDLAEMIPLKPGKALWGALLSACRTHSNSAIGEVVSKRLIDQDPTDLSAYVLLSNIYATEGKWDDVLKVRKMMVDRRLRKTVGHSLVGPNVSNSEPVKASFGSSSMMGCTV